MQCTRATDVQASGLRYQRIAIDKHLQASYILIYMSRDIHCFLTMYYVSTSMEYIVQYHYVVTLSNSASFESERSGNTCTINVYKNVIEMADTCNCIDKSTQC